MGDERFVEDSFQNMIQDCQYDILRVATNWKTETNNGTRVVSEQTAQILNNLCVEYIVSDYPTPLPLTKIHNWF